MPPVMAAPSAADAAESPLEDAVDKKDEGNTMFKLKKYKLAVRCYESALDAIPKKTKKKKVKGSKQKSEEEEARNNLKCTLHSNLALCHLKQEDYAEAMLSCGKALKINPRHVKSLGRRSQVHEKLGQMKEATRDQYLVVKLDKGNKKAIKRYMKIRTKIHARTVRNLQATIDLKLQKEAAKEAAAAEDKSDKSSRPSAAKHAKVEVESADLTEEELKSLKGYCYFNHKQTDEERRLIGAIEPKKLKVSSSAEAEDAETASKTKGGALSDWNAGGTWEERDITPKAKVLLESHLGRVSATVDGIHSLRTATAEKILLGGAETDASCAPSTTTIIAVTKVESAEGSASTPVVRRKKRFIFEFTIVLAWTVTMTSRGPDGDESSSVGSGTLRLQEVSNDDLDNGEPVDMARSVTDGGAKVTAAMLTTLEAAVLIALRAFYTELQTH